MYLKPIAFFQLRVKCRQVTKLIRYLYATKV